MNIDKQLLDDLTAQAKESPMLRMNLDLRNSDADSSQRMLNAMMPDTDVPIHKHSYAEDGNKISEHVLEAGGECPGLQIPMGVYHTTRCIEPGSVIFEAKDRAYDPVGTEELFGEAGF